MRGGVLQERSLQDAPGAAPAVDHEGYGGACEDKCPPVAAVGGYVDCGGWGVAGVADSNGVGLVSGEIAASSIRSVSVRDIIYAMVLGS